MEESMDTLTIEINSVIKDSTRNIDRLTKSLDKLEKSLKSVVKQSKNLSILKNNLGNIKVSSSTDALKKSVQKAKPFKSEESQLSSLGVNLDTYKMVSSIKTVNSELIKYKNKTGNIVTINRKFKDSADGVSKTLSDVKVKLSQTNKEVKNGTSVWSAFTKGISGSIAKVGIIVAGLRRVASTLAEFINSASSYEEALNLFTVTLGKNADDATKWVKRFSDALYLDPANVMQYMGSFNSLVKGLGVGSDSAYLMSQNLTQLVYDLSSFKNISIESAFEKLQSAMSGEIEPLRNTGVALSQATLQELANSMGIEERVSAMSEAEKAQLRYIQILKSSTEWQGDMGRTLVTPANALHVLKQQFALLGRAIGSVFIPILMEAIPYVMVLTQALTKLAQKLANLLGYKIADIDYSSLSDGITGIGEAADETTNKLNTMLAPFDELNVVQSSGKDDGDEGGSGLEFDLPSYDALASLTDRFNQNLDKAKRTLSEILPIVLGIAAGFMSWKITSALTSSKGLIELLGLGSLTAGQTLQLTLGVSLVFTGVSVAVSSLVQLITGQAENELLTWGLYIGGAIIAAIGAGMIAAALGFAAVTAGLVVLVVAAIAGIIAAIYIYWDEISAFFASIGTWIYDNVIKPVADFFVGLWNGIVDGVSGLLNTIWGFIEPFVDYIVTMWSTVINHIIDIASGIIDAVVSIGSKIFEIVSTIGQIIWALLSYVGGIIFDGIKNVIGWVNDYLIQPVITRIKGFVASIVAVVSSIVSAIRKNVIDPVVKLFSGLVSKVLGFFTDVGTSVANGIAGAFKSVLNGAFSLVEGLINGFIKGLNSVVGIVNKIPGVEIKKISKLSIPRFEDGGYPSRASLFYANENGIPEMVGRIGNQTAVANNDQITTAITNALMSALNNSNIGNSKPSTTIVNIGGRKVYEGMGDYIDSENDRYGTSYVHV